MNKPTTYTLISCAMLFATTFATHEPLQTVAHECSAAQCPLPQEDTISCINIEADTIIFNGADWSPLFQTIEQIQDTSLTEQKSISIIHLGDSHIQAGFFTEAMRRPLQKAWGNAGRGLITPLKISKTNEPSDYRITTPGEWQFSRCIPGKFFSNLVGASGILIEPVGEQIDLTFETMSRQGEDLKFNKLRLFHADTENFPQLQVTDEPEGLTITPPYGGETCYSWDTPVNKICLVGNNGHTPADAAIYGASLENGKSGIIVHTIGNNSATFDCYNRVDDYGKKLAALTPQLVIISLGTNESVATTIYPERLTKQIDLLIQSIKKECPEALFLLTTPADNKLRKTKTVTKMVGKRKKKKKRKQTVTYYVENTNLALVAETIKEYGVKNNIAVWDWYTIAGGDGSCEKWIKEGGMRNDHIHYTAKGYSIQGNLLYKSLLNAYEQHIR